MDFLKVRMLGEFSLCFGDRIISDAGNRSKKVWNLLAYLIYNRERSISQQKLIDLLWGEDAASTNPENAMRITLYRVRTMLDQLWDGAGRELIIRREGGYGWNSAIEMELDCDRFLRLVQSSAGDEERRLQDMLDGLKLYQGAFLSRQASEMWVIPVSTHYQAQYLAATLEAAGLLSIRGRHEEAAQICRNATATEPYHEPLYQHLMQALAAMGDVRGAVAVYERLNKRLVDDFGIQPSEETRTVYRNATQAPKDRPMPVEEVLEDLHEPDSQAGAMQCDYDYFKVLCFAESRAMERNGNTTHIALLSISGGGEGLQKAGLVGQTMDRLGAQLRQNLRRGDVISRCSASQYIVMLPKANYENSCMVCRRVIAAFQQKHPLPQAGAKINFIVQPLTAGMRVP